jgi:CRISPR-associated protein Cmr6
MTDKKNIGLFFYRGYYNDYFGKNGLRNKKGDEQLDEAGKKNKLFKEFSDITLKTAFKIADSHHAFELKTVYPGLYTGSGYAFGAGLNGEFQSGFLFDHTTGLPYIPASSVKGVIRSVFPNYPGMGSKINKKTENKDERVQFIWDEIMEMKKSPDVQSYFTPNFKDIDSKLFVRILELEIFEGRNIAKEERKKEKSSSEEINEEYLSVYKRDIFYDAYISKTVQAGKTQSKFLGLDYITPHKDKPLKNPVPLPFLKILPGVTVNFQFGLHDGYFLTAKGKKRLFEKIILNFGIGAKTNVGYGQFSK